MLNDNITRAIDALYTKIEKSVLDDNEKNILKLLLDQMSQYYIKEYSKIMKNRNDYKINKLVSTMTSYIVTVNDAINGEYDIISITDMLKGYMTANESKRLFKRKD